jgi:minor extracellular serine protease Vpr
MEKRGEHAPGTDQLVTTQFVRVIHTWRRRKLNLFSRCNGILTVLASLAIVLGLGFGAPGVRASSGSQVAPSAPVYWSHGNTPKSDLPNAWFVQLPSAPTADGTSQSQVQSEQAAFLSTAQAEGLKFKLRFSYSKLWNGVAITLDHSQVSRLSGIPGVKAIYPVGIESLPPTQLVTPSDAFSLPLIGADTVQSELGYTGQGVKVGIIDTGIDYTHPDLGACTHIGSGCRTAYGFDFVGDNYDSNPLDPTYNPVAAPDNDPMDCAGHGTHVAGIVGANGNLATGGALGVAPGVTFGAYRVFGCIGSTDDSVILTAMERAYSDGMQIISMSLGDSFESWPQYPTADAASRLVNHGVVVVAAAGNDGTSGTFATGAPSTGSNVISVASYDNTQMATSSFTLNPSGTVIPYLPIADVPAPATSATSSDPIVYVGRGCPIDPAFGITSPDPYLTSPTGKTALIIRGACSFNDKYQRAVAAGATTVIIYNNVAGLFNGGSVANTSPSVNLAGISLADGQAIRSQIATTPATTLTWTNASVNAPVPTGGLISSFSSYGLAADLTLKPDLGAPGGFIRSTWPVSMGSYATLSGTSMATPHVTGAVALLLQARPRTQASAVRDILQNTASPKNWSLNRGLGLLDDVQRQGAGMIQIDKAILSTTRIAPGKLSLVASAGGISTNTLTIANSGTSAKTYTLSDVPAISTTTPEEAPSFDWAPANVAFSAPSVTVPAGGSASVTVTISPNSFLDDGDIYGGYLTFTPQGGGQVYHVPYAGYKGDYEAIQYLTTAPTLASVDPAGKGFLHSNYPAPGQVPYGYTPQPSGATYTLTDWQNMPYFLVHLAHPAQELRMDVFDAVTGKAWHTAIDARYMPRNSTSGSIFDFSWDGTTAYGNGGNHVLVVPNGKYVIKLTVVKALGNPSVASNTETWTSPTITIARPSNP